MRVRYAALLAATALTAGAAALNGPKPSPTAAAAADQSTPRKAIPPEQRRAFFGELHLHTTMSFDAWTFGTKVTPDQAYKFARGETVMVPAAQALTEQGITASGPIPVKRGWPLDFAAVTDHSEYLGAVAQLEDPNSPFSKSKIGQLLRQGGRQAFFTAGEAVRGVNNEYSGDLRAAAQAADGWNVEMRAANANYQPGKFTTLIGYEWTSTPGRGVHTHRNVIFAGDSAPTPYTSVDSNRPEDLWKWMEGQRGRGVKVLAIPHNANLSDGRDFDYNNWDGKPIDAAYAALQQRNEPLVEIAQTKGTSETTIQLSPNDEFANFEIMDRIYAGETTSKQHGSYLREGWGRGLELQAKLGANPFKMGVVGGSDIHNGLTTSDENAATASSNGLDPKTLSPTGVILRRALGEEGAVGARPNGQRENDPLQFASGALTGVWADENTREAVFAALARKETFATSGTRIRVRMFGGWGFTPAMLKGDAWIKTAYATGAPMGGDLPAGSGAPTFIVQAMKDPTGAMLDRIQVIKLWLTPTGYREKVFDAVRGPGKGSVMLQAVWRDPEFDPKVQAAYYARVIEWPTPRWTTLLAMRNHLPPPKRVPETIQERAWTSPIWYAPK